MRQEGRGRSLGALAFSHPYLLAYAFLGVPPTTRHFITSSLRHFPNGDGGIGPRFPVFGPRWREGARGKGSKAVGQ